MEKCLIGDKLRERESGASGVRDVRGVTTIIDQSGNCHLPVQGEYQHLSPVYQDHNHIDHHPRPRIQTYRQEPAPLNNQETAKPNKDAEWFV